MHLRNLDVLSRIRLTAKKEKADAISISNLGHSAHEATCDYN